jgi:hypothetical protein
MTIPRYHIGGVSTDELLILLDYQQMLQSLNNVQEDTTPSEPTDNTAANRFFRSKLLVVVA